MDRARQYLATMGASLVVLAVAAVTLSVTVDPYWVFGSSIVPGWTALKPRAAQRAELAKQHLLTRMRPRTVLLGNSRVEIGLDPANSDWPGPDRPVFNAALAGHDLSSSVKFLEQGIQLGSLRSVVVGVDYQDFLDDGAPQPAQVDLPDRLVGPSTRWADYWKQRLAVTLTIDAVLDSAYTLFEQSALTGATMTQAGFNPLHEYALIAQREGYYSLFEQKQAEYLARYRQFKKPDFSVPMRNREFRYLAQILDRAIQHDCKVVLFIDPYHANYLDMLHELGLWPGFEAWKRALLQVVDQHNPGHRNLVQVFDFSGYNEVSTERVPPRGDRRTVMRWYWEPGHFKSALGARIIARIIGLDDSFGYELTPSTIDAVLSRINADRVETANRATISRGDGTRGSRIHD